PAKLATVVGDPGQLEQVLMNLCLNARDAVAGRGEVTVRADCTELSASDLQGFEWARPGPFARIRVIDDGPGIPPEHAARLFEPFFTTKAASEGSGLGLAIVWSIVQQHGGTVEVSSACESGTCVVVQIPLAAAASRPERPSWTPRAVEGQGRLLLAEDDGFVRKFMQRTLEGAGYELRVAPDGEE
ncbi:MAG: hybrid sensor histidine kinase/response regulator, partial [Caldilinea sp.]|nr:hybrid sensor histidine kinase/response regulator [Caldilinea sp.]